MSKSILLLFVICALNSKATAQFPDFPTDTVFVPYDQAVPTDPGGTFFCGLLSDSGDHTYEYYRLDGTDSLVYATHFYKGKLIEEGLYSNRDEYGSIFFENLHCWLRFSLWKYYDDNGILTNLINFSREDEQLDQGRLELAFTGKFKVVWVE